MNLKTKYMTDNECFRAGRKITPKGIMVHSTATPGVMAWQWFSRWNKPGVKACVHAFIDDKEVWQYLPWDHRGWHAAGAANNSYVSFEICEPAGFKYGSGSAMVGYDVKKNEAYFRAAWNNAVELCVMLCKQFGLNETHIIDHAEGYKMGVASNHGDVSHWVIKHGETMGTFRTAVKAALARAPIPHPVIKIGDKGGHVTHMQTRLCRHGFGITVDGAFGPDSENKLRQFQAANGLTADGICGSQTWAALENEIQTKDDDGMTQEQFGTMFATAMAAYNKDIASQPPSSWAKDNWDKMCAAGMFDGTSPRGPLTREQAAIVFSRLR